MAGLLTLWSFYPQSSPSLSFKMGMPRGNSLPCSGVEVSGKTLGYFLKHANSTPWNRDTVWKCAAVTVGVKRSPWAFLGDKRYSVRRALDFWFVFLISLHAFLKYFWWALSPVADFVAGLQVLFMSSHNILQIWAQLHGSADQGILHLRPIKLCKHRISRKAKP